MPDDNGDKTEDPSDHRRQESRQKGNIARSQDLVSAGHMMAAAFVLMLLGIPTVKALAELMHSSLSAPAWRVVDRHIVMNHFSDLAGQLNSGVLPVFLMMFVAALFFNFAQVGFLITPDAVMPKWSRMDPIQGAKRIISIQAIVKLIVSMGKLVVMITLAVMAISYAIPEFLALSDQEPPIIFFSIQQSMARLAFQLALALIVLALVDYGFQKWKFEQDLKMSKQEVRDEMKQMDGDPHMRQRRKEAHRKLAQAREMQGVPDADLVVTNPTQIAIALKYNPEEMDAPKVVAKGKGEIAAKIRMIAAEHGVPIIERKPVAQALYRDVKVGQQIPVEMYEIFVELMAYVYKITGRKPPDLV